ncbi:hypothetical protein LDENG_00231610 [Lucifuga dentata]|nr:hypothetical protein LDENG_00231610 [Lucifuga dentata]
MFQNYLLLINASGDEWPDARKRALLLHCLGTEGQRIFLSLPNTGDTYDGAVAALKAHFIAKVNVVVEQHMFRKRVQGPNESILQYIAALRDLASTCDFGEMCKDMIRDKFVEHVASHRIRERLLLESGLTLEKAITLATETEAATVQAKTISGEQQISV